MVGGQRQTVKVGRYIADYRISRLTLLLIYVYVLFRIVARSGKTGTTQRNPRFAEFGTRDIDGLSLEIGAVGGGAQRPPVQPAISQTAISQSAIRGNIDAFQRRSPVLHPLRICAAAAARWG